MTTATSEKVSRPSGLHLTKASSQSCLHFIFKELLRFIQITEVFSKHDSNFLLFNVGK